MSIPAYPLLPIPTGCTPDQYSYKGSHSNAIALAPNENALTRAQISACCPTLNITALNDNCLLKCDLGSDATIPAFVDCLSAESEFFLNATNSTGQNATSYVNFFESGATKFRGVGTWTVVAVMVSALFFQGF